MPGEGFRLKRQERTGCQFFVQRNDHSLDVRSRLSHCFDGFLEDHHRRVAGAVYNLVVR